MMLCVALMTGANILTPDNANEGYDFIWAFIWILKAARDNCWE